RLLPCPAGTGMKQVLGWAHGGGCGRCSAAAGCLGDRGQPRRRPGRGGGPRGGRGGGGRGPAGPRGGGGRGACPARGAAPGRGGRGGRGMCPARWSRPRTR